MAMNTHVYWPMARLSTELDKLPIRWFQHGVSQQADCAVTIGPFENIHCLLGEPAAKHKWCMFSNLLLQGRHLLCAHIAVHLEVNDGTLYAKSGHLKICHGISLA